MVSLVKVATVAVCISGISALNRVQYIEGDQAHCLWHSSSNGMCAGDVVAIVNEEDAV